MRTAWASIRSTIFVYVRARQYPANPNDATTGPNGVLLFYDPAPLAQPLTTLTAATLTPISGGGPAGSVRMHLGGRSIRLDAALTGVAGKSALLNVTTTVGNEVVQCGIDYSSQNAVCNGNLLGDPMVGGVVMLGVEGAPAASGLISVASQQEAADLTQ